jgi:HlyD family secretion protein
MKKILIIAIAAAVLLAAALMLRGRGTNPQQLVLHGNVDLRQIELPFADSERIADILVEEGDAVRAGQVLARLDTGRLLPKVQQAEARVAAQAAVLARLKNGSRPEETAQARALLTSAQAEATNARSQYERLKGIGASSEGRAVSEQELDAAAAAARMSEARVENSRKALDLALAGPRKEDIEQAAAQWHASEAELALLRRQLHDAELVAPTDAVVRNRLMEPGEFATPQRAVLSLALTHPKWIRAYLPESALTQVKPGTPASITIDSLAGDAKANAPLAGTVGFISSVAEFTPKTVQTEELRTALAYEIRVLVQDPEDRLRLGMPATVRLDLSSQPASPTPAANHTPPPTASASVSTRD